MELRPLTLLLGANSSGKSSILHLFLMLEQTINNAENYSTAFKSNGHCVNMGEDENILKDKKHGNTLALEFDINAEQYIKWLRSRQEDRVMRTNSSFLIYLKSRFPDKYELLAAQMEQMMDTIKKSHNSDLNVPLGGFFNDSSDAFYRFLMRGHFDKDIAKDLWAGIDNAETLENAMAVLRECFNQFEEEYKDGANKASIRYEFYYSESSKKLNVRNCKIAVDDKSLIKITLQNKKPILESEVFNTNQLSILTEIFDLQVSFRGLAINSDIKAINVFTDFITDFVAQAYQQLVNYFSKRYMRYVGPLRANPQRYYFLDDSNTNLNLDNRNGASLAEVLKKNTLVKEKINSWIERFGLNVDVKEFKDVIHNIKITQNGLLLDIPDVGFGISQVLPILVEGMMAPARSTIIMEQPEIHLHPKMQAELADLFIDMINLASKERKSINKSLIIETHSEYILKRIRRRMAEGIISPSHVAIYFVKPRNAENPDSAQLEMATINKDGTIEWPRDFYITELEDELAFFKLKVAKS